MSNKRKERMIRIKEYAQKLTTVGIHTISGMADGEIDYERIKKHKIITHFNYSKNRKGKTRTYMRINPNGYNDGYIAEQYSEFVEIINNVFAELGVTNFEIKRVNLSFSAIDKTYYETYSKINRLLIACLALSETDYNTFDDIDFWAGSTKSMCAKNSHRKNSHREIEFYNKFLESNGKSPYSARLELRSKEFNCTIKEKFVIYWFRRLENAVKEFKNVQKIQFAYGGGLS